MCPTLPRQGCLKDVTYSPNRYDHIQGTVQLYCTLIMLMRDPCQIPTNEIKNQKKINFFARALTLARLNNPRTRTDSPMQSKKNEQMMKYCQTKVNPK